MNEATTNTVSKLQAVLEKRADDALTVEKSATEQAMMDAFRKYGDSRDYLTIKLSGTDTANNKTVSYTIRVSVFQTICDLVSADIENKRAVRRERAVAEFVAKVDAAAEKVDAIAEEVDGLRNEFSR